MATRDERPSVVAVIVSFNRRDLLLESVAAVLGQSEPPDALVVVDNASEDGSAEAVLARFPGIDLVPLTRNVGGAGGFAVGLAHAITRYDATWVWAMDDDTIPTPAALAELMAGVRRDRRVALAGSRVIWTDGQDHPMNTPRADPFAGRDKRRSADEAGAVPVRSSSFVSMLVRADAVLADGLPVADYFIWNDDFEFSCRILRRRSGWLLPGSVVVHKTARLGSTDLDPGPRFYYEVRNKIWLFTRSDCLGPGEKVIYGVSTLLRWARTIGRSADRGLLLDGLRRGVAAARRPPRSNSQVLAGIGAGAEAVEEFERRRSARG